MQFRFETASYRDVRADLVAVFIGEERKQFERDMKVLQRDVGSSIATLLETGDFTGKAGETALVYLEKKVNSHRLLLVGLGEVRSEPAAQLEQYRRAAAAAAKRAQTLTAKSIALSLPRLSQHSEEAILAFAEGAGLALYKFDKYKSKKKSESTRVQSIILCSEDRVGSRAGRSAVARAQVIVEAASLARDLANAPGNEIYPETLARAAVKSGKRAGYSVRVLDERQIEKLGMGGIIGVAKGSARPPRFLILEYGRIAKTPVVLVGKGVTFDTGGISIKPSANMGEMKMDMSGAAAVIGTFEAVARLKLPIHLIGLIPAVENMPSGTATRPGDILRHFNGKTSEVDNTDAEGRLILADALAYAERYKPSAVIDLATLTGACVVALGHHATGMMGNDEKLMEQLKIAGERTYERVWPLPLYDEYEKQIKSDVADVKNTGGRWAGAITAGWFLKKFIGKYSWVHLDIAGTAMLEEKGDYTQKGASGVGVRLLAEFLRTWK
jgi:leucyl aminopeptidase